MKFRKNSTHEFCVTNAPGLGTDCLHKVTHFDFVRFLSENSLHSKFFHSRSQPTVRNNSLAVQMKFDLLAHLVAYHVTKIYNNNLP